LPQGFQQSQIYAASGAHPAQIQNEQRPSSGARGLLCQRQGIGAGASGVLHGRMNDRITQPEVQAEHHARRTDQIGNRL